MKYFKEGNLLIKISPKQVSIFLQNFSGIEEVRERKNADNFWNNSAIQRYSVTKAEFKKALKGWELKHTLENV